ncbi:MAG TPA: GNAT family N-acetyltransferase [Candidatus Gallacutalibacter pullistercoris]|nr:GNAT family N-acetyltransferase [Candidatus Gallacutalibacter pullistercoris]
MRIQIIKAETEEQKEQFLQVLRSANDRMAQKGIIQWLPCHLTAEAVFEEGFEPYLLLCDGIPAATALLVTEDPVFWPEKQKGSAVYIHRLSVAQGFAGTGLPQKMLEFAAGYARKLGIFCLRLDCRADREKLRAVYEAFGFRFVDTVEVDVPQVHLCNARYEYCL